MIAAAPDVDEAVEFESMRLCRQLLKAISDLSWGHPTPIQARMVPIALLGRDCCANAVTGIHFFLLLRICLSS
jgi:ATP-dependent RNA helicase DDX27